MNGNRHTSPSWDVESAYQQLKHLSGLSSKNHGGGEKKFIKKEGTNVPAVAVSAIILDELSRTFSEICNFVNEVDQLNTGRILDAYQGVLAKCEGIQEVSPLAAWVKAQAKASVSKLSVPGLDQKSATYKQWWADEHQCLRTNQKIRAYRSRYNAGVKPLPWGYEIARLSKFISYVIGDEPDTLAVLQRSKYGPGASVEVRGDATHYANKLLSWDCTSGAVDLAVAALTLDKAAWEVIGFDPREATNPDAIFGFQREAKKMILDGVVNHDALMFIFKNAKALRSIGAQPTLSGMIQLGVDSVVKELLKNRVNIDLEDQELNRKLAWAGSKDWRQPNSWCTLDKSSASNLVAKMLPGMIFPRKWSSLLWSIRSPQYLAPDDMGGGMHTYEMYAGMGNGTTFAVESLIFAAIAYAVSDLEEPADCLKTRIFSVFGDDMILRREHVDNYIRLAEFLGFRINMEKSFFEGPFRESCGADYWDGINIRPAYVKGERDLNEIELVGVHNTIMDSPFYCMLNACKRIRALWKKHFPWPVPSDPIGGLGFRTTNKVAWQFVEKDGKPVLSPAWHRPRGFVLDVKSKDDTQVGTSSYLSLNIALHRGSQKAGVEEDLSLPFRNAIKIRVVPEVDLSRKDLLQMLSNQLQRLAQRKQAPWWSTSRGE